MARKIIIIGPGLQLPWGPTMVWPAFSRGNVNAP